jgi:HEAT repeat protein
MLTLRPIVCVFAALLAASAATLSAADNAALEQELLAVLRSDAPDADKAITCKKLAIHGSSECVADLAKLLSNPKLASWARIPLEAIPGSAADEALRKASESLSGELLVGVINSIGVRRDAGAVELLSKRLQDEDLEVASAAAVALGRIGTDAASKSLRGALAKSPDKLRNAVAEGYVLCAERRHAEGQSAEAVAIYDEIRQADVPKPRKVEATRGAILARGQQGLPLLLEQLRSEDRTFFRLGLGVAREFPGAEVDKALAAELSNVKPDRAALIVQAMADRTETVDPAAILAAAQTGPKEVRLSAIDALGRVGDSSCLTTLLDLAVGPDANLAQAAKTALSVLPGEKVNAQLAALLPNVEGDKFLLLIELVGQRRIQAVPALVKALENPEKAIRSAALRALGETVDLQGLNLLITHSIAPKRAEDAPVAQQALRAASVRMPDREAAAAALSAAMSQAPAATKITLLEILGEMEGATALKTIAAAAKSNDPQLQDAGSRLAGKWSSVEAAPVLLDLAKTAPTAQYRIRALKGYISLARRFPMPDEERAEMCRNALALARQPAEQNLVLDVLKLHASTEGMKLAIAAMKTPGLQEDATHAVLVIAHKLETKKVDVSPLLAQAGLSRVKLEIIKAEYGAGNNLKDVTGILRRQIGTLPVIMLSSSSYNTSFGGDPAPGSAKKLTIQYKIDGKPGQASFAEDALIILPIPK